MKDVLVLTLHFNEGDDNRTMEIRINKTRDLKDVYKKVGVWLEKHSHFIMKNYTFKVLYKNQVMKENLSLEEAGITTHCNLVVILFEKEKKPSEVPEKI